MQTAVQRIPAANAIESLINALSVAIRKLHHKIATAVDLQELCLRLETLPLSTDEFTAAKNRLRNANRYMNSGEYGAANWELRTLRLSLLRRGPAVGYKSRLRTWTD